MGSKIACSFLSWSELDSTILYSHPGVSDPSRAVPSCPVSQAYQHFHHIPRVRVGVGAITTGGTHTPWAEAAWREGVFWQAPSCATGFWAWNFLDIGCYCKPGEGKSLRFTYFINQEDVKMCQWLVSGCLGDLTPVLMRKSCRHPFLWQDKKFALLQTNPHSTPQIWCWGMQCCWSTLLLWAHSSQCFPPPNISLAVPAKALAVVLDAEDCCCFPLERSLLPLQKSLETLKSSQGHFHTRGYCIHRMRQLLLDESGMSLATVKVWGEIHMSQLVLAPTRPGQGKARLTDVCVGLLSTQKLFSCASTFSYF